MAEASQAGEPNSKRQKLDERGAMDVWGAGIVAIGPHLADGKWPPPLRGSGFVVDAEAGLICSCAHVLLDCHRTKGSLDPDGEGLAIGVGDPIEWVYRAEVRSVSYYPKQVPPEHWSFPAALEPGLDLVVLQLVGRLEGATMPQSAWPPLAALPLGDAGALKKAESKLVVGGFGQATQART